MSRVKKDINPRNDKGQAHGYWEVYWWNGELRYKCVVHNGNVIGYEEDYRYNGKLNKKRYHL